METFKKLPAVLLIAVMALSGCSNSYGDRSPQTAADTSRTAYALSPDNTPSTVLLTSAPAVSEPLEIPREDGEPEYVDFFRENKVHELRIDMSYNDWLLMLGDPYSDEYRHADITIDGMTMKDSGIHPRGRTSLELGVSYGKNRLPFKLKFDKYDKDGSFLGLDELCLDNSACDPSLLRQYIGMEAFRALGVNAPYVCFFDVYVNGDLHGFYVGIEAVDSSFLERSFGSHKHKLYKADRNATLSPGMSMSALVQKKGKDEGRDELSELIAVLDETPPGEKGRLEEVIDVDLVLRNFAVNAVLHNWDDYAGESSHNYYLYLDGGVFRMIPWDLNEILLQTESGEREGPGSKQDILTPITGYVAESDRPLVSRLLSVDEYYEKYIGYCAEASRWMREFGTTRLDGLREFIEEHYLNDPTKVYSYTSFSKQFNTADREGAAGFIKERCDYLDQRIPEILAEKGIVPDSE